MHRHYTWLHLDLRHYSVHIFCGATGNSSFKKTGSVMFGSTHQVIDINSLAMTIDAIPTCALIVNELGIIVFVNKEFESTLQFSAAEVIGQSLDILLPERVSADHASLVQGFVQKPQKRLMGQGRALFARRKDRSEIPVEIGLNPLITERGLYTLATITDISEQQRTGILFRQMVESAPYGILVVQNGTIFIANKHLCSMFGYAEEALRGKPVELLLPERYRQHHLQIRTEYAKNPELRAMGPGRDLTALHHDGYEFPIEVGLNPLEVGNERYILVAVIDISERKKMEMDLRRTNGNLEEFIYVASHDLRSPLRGISDLLSWIEEDLGDNPPEAIAKNVNRMAIRIQRLEQLIDNLLRYARAGKTPNDQQQIDLRQLLNCVIEMIEVPTGFTIKTDLQLEHIIAAQTPLETVLRNVISNAIKHHDSQQGEIVLSATADGSYCYISI